MNKHTYIVKGREAFESGSRGRISYPASWQDRAFNQGWDTAQAEFLADDVKANVPASKGVAVNIRLGLREPRAKRDAKRRMEATVKKVAHSLHMHNMDKDNRRLANRSWH